MTLKETLGIAATDAELIGIWFKTMELEELSFGEVVAPIPRAMKKQKEEGK